ncbi:MAG: response regulator transcription factor [Treponema sp.]|nr:response regulator transcription factor [Treponema sp.]
MPYKILIADDEKEVIELLRLYLEKDGYTVLAAYDGITALGIVTSEELACAVIDIMMPELNGFQLLKKIREKNNVPVIMLTARVSSADKILGLDMGADDYITKPFDPLEAAARIKAHIRRYLNTGAGLQDAAQPPAELHVGPLTLDVQKCTLVKNGVPIELTSTEFHVMQLFLSSPGRVFTKAQISAAGWGEESYVEDNSIMVALSKLRAKLGGESWIKNIRGLGYRLEIKND